MRRWRRLLLVMGLLLAAHTVALAAAKAFQVSVVADGTTLGTASASLDASVADGKVAWKITNGHFSANSLPEAKVDWEDSILSGSGSVASASEVTLKTFTVTVEQNTGVDISYRFRLSATLADGAVKSVSITQVK